MISAGPEAGLRIRLDQLLELEEQRGVLVPGEQPEEHPVGQLEGAAWRGATELEQAPVVGDGADVLDPLGWGGSEAQEVAAPGAGILLLLHHRHRGLRLAHRLVGGLDAPPASRTRPGPAPSGCGTGSTPRRSRAAR